MAIFANWHSPQSRLELIDLKLDVADFATLRGRGELLQSRMSLDAAVKVSDLAKSWDDRVVAWCANCIPSWGTSV
jgi:hypothetical protein